MDVIPGVALNQYLIRDTEERVESVSVCVSEAKTERDRS